jgi:hypothetical protein
MGDGERAA